MKSLRVLSLVGILAGFAAALAFIAFGVSAAVTTSYFPPARLHYPPSANASPFLRPTGSKPESVVFPLTQDPKFAKCMVAHGVTNFSGRGFQIGNGATFQAAWNRCKSLLP